MPYRGSDLYQGHMISPEHPDWYFDDPTPAGVAAQLAQWAAQQAQAPAIEQAQNANPTFVWTVGPGGGVVFDLPCPANLVENAVYRAPPSPNQFVWQGGALHLIPDEETLVAGHYPPFRDIKPECLASKPMGAAIPSAKNSGGPRGGVLPGPGTLDRVQAWLRANQTTALIGGAGVLGAYLLTSGGGRRRR